MVLKTLADIFHHQHIFPLIFIVVHQPFAQTLGLLIVRMAGDGACQRFSAQQRAASPPQAFRRRAEERVAGVKDHTKMIAVEV